MNIGIQVKWGFKIVSINGPAKERRVKKEIRKTPTFKSMKSKNYTAMGLALGAGIGAALGVATGKPGLWISLGLALGIAIGGGMQRKYNTRRDQDSDQN